MACNCTKVAVSTGGRTFFVDEAGAREVTGLVFSPTNVQTMTGASTSSLALPMLGFGVLGGSLAKLTGASWLLAGGIAVAAPLAVVLALSLAARGAPSS